jgi:hypothetical protein
LAAVGALLGLVLSAGCVSLGSLIPGGESVPTGPVCQIVATWHNEVVFTPDPVHGGAQTPGLAGRVYLFGQEIKYPLGGEGTIVVDLYDDTLVAAGKPPVLLEEWRFDKDTLKRLLRRDAVGWGYTLFLPWGTFKPEIRHVRLRLRYEVPGAAPIYNESTVTFHNDTLPTPPLISQSAKRGVPLPPAQPVQPVPSLTRS